MSVYNLYFKNFTFLIELTKKLLQELSFVCGYKIAMKVTYLYIFLICDSCFHLYLLFPQLAFLVSFNIVFFLMLSFRDTKGSKQSENT